jgi:hypothetical protein
MVSMKWMGKEFSKQRIAQGLCIRCSRKAENGHTRCRPCIESGNRSSRKICSNPARRKIRNEKTKQWRHNMRRTAIEAYGSACKCCGEMYDPFLTFDHVNENGNSHRKSLGGSGMVKLQMWLRRNNYPPTIQVLCANCHIAKSKGMPCPVTHKGHATTRV